MLSVVTTVPPTEFTIVLLTKLMCEKGETMKTIKLVILVAIFTSAAASLGATKFRSGIFLHHSTGGRIWGPNGSQVSVPSEIAKYNSSHGLAGSDSVKMSQVWSPAGVHQNDNEWATWHIIFDNADTSNDIRPILASNPIVMIKSCFPSSAMARYGTSADTLTPTVRSVWNYKWHWRYLISVMKEHPQNFFVIWTNAPLVAGATNATSAALSDNFCRWAKDTLSKGLDPRVGAFPKNIFVFDFFHLLAGSDGMLPLSLAASSTDSHPNSAATALVAPQLVKQIFDAALVYEANPAPIQLAEFSATFRADSSSVFLQWKTISEVSNYGFEVQRKTVVDSEFLSLPDGFVPGHGTTIEPHEYQYVDSHVVKGQTLYRLKQIDSGNTFSYTDPVSVLVATAIHNYEPSVFEDVLGQNFPNPFNPATVIRFSISRRSHVVLTVFNCLGQSVSTLLADDLEPGSHEVQFHAGNLASGLYYYRIRAGGFDQTKKLMLVR